MAFGIPKFVCFKCRKHRRSFTGAVPHCPSCRAVMSRTYTGWNKIPANDDDKGWASLETFSNRAPPKSQAEYRAEKIGRKE